MLIKVETEKKYYCIEPELLVKMAEKIGFKEISKTFESDEYFTDIDLEFIKNRTCLRIRKNGKEKMEITFKGKSTSLLNHYCKLENNVTADISEYDNYLSLFSSLGFYSYVLVEKNRITYTLEKGIYSYSIMIDKLDNIGGFVEFEIVATQEDANKAELTKELDNFVSMFDELNLKEALKPYRDIVADYIYNNLIKSKQINDMYVSIDSEIEKHEKDFFKKYKEEISLKCGNNIKWIEYKNNPSVDNKIGDLVDKYLSNLIFDNNQLFVAVNLLNKINLKKHFVTKINEIFFTHLLGKLNIELDNIIYLKDNNLPLFMKKNNIEIDEQIIIDNKNVKELNSNLMIMIDNKLGE